MNHTGVKLLHYSVQICDNTRTHCLSAKPFFTRQWVFPYKG